MSLAIFKVDLVFNNLTKKTFNKNLNLKEPLGQFQLNLVGYMLVRWGYRFVHKKGLAPFGAQ